MIARLRAADPLLAALRVTLLAGLAASWSHLAEIFALFYSGDYAVQLGMVAATAVDGTLYVLAEVLGRLATSDDDGRGRRSVYAGAFGLLAVSALANLDAAVAALAGERAMAGVTWLGVDALDWARAAIGAGTLPLGVAFMLHSLARLHGARPVSEPVLEAPTVVVGPAPAPARPAKPRHTSARSPHTDEDRERVAQLGDEGLSQRAIAAKTGVPRSTVARWLRADAT